MASATLDLACELIRRRSITPADAGCLELLGERLRVHGFEVDYLPFGRVSNLWARRGTGTPVFTFAGHTDVVPPGEGEGAAWESDPFEPSIREGRLYGRGAADMKGGLAAMVTAAERFCARHPRFSGTLSFLLTSDEEGTAVDGTARVVKHLAAQRQPLTWCLVGEPSSEQHLGDTIRNGRRGSLNARLYVHGIQGHVAYPEKAANPVHLALPALEALRASRWDNGNEFFPATSFQISNLRAGTGTENLIPAILEVWFNFRYSTASTAEALQTRVAAILDGHGLDYRIEWHHSGAPFINRGGRLLDAARTAIIEILDVTPRLSTGGGTSDGRFLAPAGAEVIELGPCNATIHKVNECVPADDLDRLSQAYERILERLLTAA